MIQFENGKDFYYNIIVGLTLIIKVFMGCRLMEARARKDGPLAKLSVVA